MTNVRYFSSAAGQEPAREYMRACDEKQRMLLGRKIRQIQDTSIGEAGADVSIVKGREPLMELRIGYHRVFYVVTTVAGVTTMWLLHACQKEGDKAKRFDLQAAERRMRELFARLGVAQG
jgi:phage-related protein